MNLDKLLFLISTIRILDVIDILIVSFVFYKIFSIIRGTRATQLIKGILVIFVFSKLTGFLRLYTINWILSNAITLGFVALVIVFQPELRRILEHIGTNSILKKNISKDGKLKLDNSVNEIVKAIFSLAEKNIGALIVIERKTGLKEVAETGIHIDSGISYELLMNIFIPNTPLHDGAVVIKDGRILSASCFLPLSENKNISMELGTRHRAGIGISEKSDSIVLIASEESGGVSIAEQGVLHRYLSEDYVRNYLLNALVDSVTTESSASIGGFISTVFLKIDKYVDVEIEDRVDENSKSQGDSDEK